MPDTDGKLTEEDHAKVRQWLRDKKVTAACTQCGENNWGVESHLMNMTSLDHRRVMPSFILTCNNCGVFIPFSAMMAGIVPRDEGESGEKNG